MESSGASSKCKVVLLGDQSVGKTSIINRLIFDNFTGNQQPTVGVDFVSKTISVQNKQLRMQLWDTAGQQRYHSLIPSYIKDCSAAVIVFDLTNQNSFNNLSKWIDNVRQVRGEDALILVMGNKCDLKTDTQQNFSQSAKQKLKQINLIYLEVSAKTGQNIKEFFKQLAYAVCGITSAVNPSSSSQKVQKQQAVKTPTKSRPSNIPEHTNAKSINLSGSAFKQGKNSKGKKKCC